MLFLKEVWTNPKRGCESEGQILKKIISWASVVHTCNPSYLGSGGLWFWASPGK
jgi:hypothetical protein